MAEKFWLYKWIDEFEVKSMADLERGIPAPAASSTVRTCL